MCPDCTLKARRSPEFEDQSSVDALAGLGGLRLCGGGAEGGDSAELKPFPEAEEAASGTTVIFFMYGGDDATNAYVDAWVAPRLEEEYGITLERTPVSDVAEVVNKLLNEKGWYRYQAVSRKGLR